MTDLPVLERRGIKYLDLGPKDGVPLLLLHGLFGTASNFDALISHFSEERRLIMPFLPIFEMSLRKLSVSGLRDFVHQFISQEDLQSMDVLGNSLGGHLALLFTFEYPSRVRSLTLTGSSGLYESAFGTSFPKREDYEFIRKKVALTFYDPTIATDEMVDEVFQIVNDRSSAIRIIKTAKSAIRHNVGSRLNEVNCPTLLIWGKQDNITPPFVAKKFDELIENSELHFLDHCGHAPMLEKPDEFNDILSSFLLRLDEQKA